MYGGKLLWMSFVWYLVYSVFYADSFSLILLLAVLYRCVFALQIV